VTSITIEDYFTQDDCLGFIALRRPKTTENRFEKRCSARGPKTRQPRSLLFHARLGARKTMTSAAVLRDVDCASVDRRQLVAMNPFPVVGVGVLTFEFESASSEGDRKQPPSGENGEY
jgi:hypothetical protein